MQSDANEVDRAIGRRVRMRRSQLGLSYEDVAGALDVSSEQVRKFEAGEVRISAQKLYALSVLMRVRVSYFFDLLLPIDLSKRYDASLLLLKQRLFDAFESIENGPLKLSIVELVEAVGEFAAHPGGKVIPFRPKDRD